jgi:integrase
MQETGIVIGFLCPQVTLEGAHTFRYFGEPVGEPVGEPIGGHLTMIRKLNQALVNNPPPPPVGRRRHYIWDEELTGFALEVIKRRRSKTLTRSFIVMFRRKPGGPKERRLIGNATFMRFDRAKGEAQSILGMIANDRLQVRLGKVEEVRDPFEQRTNYAAARSKGRKTLQQVCEEYINLEGGKIRTIEERKSLLNRLVLPWTGANSTLPLGERPIASIGKADFAQLFDSIASGNRQVGGGIHAAGKARVALGKILSWYESRTDGFVNPLTKALQVAGLEHSERKRVLTLDEMRDVWQASFDTAVSKPFGAYCRALLVIPCRVNELRLATIDCLGQNGYVDSLTVPEERSKTIREIAYPVSPLAREQMNDYKRGFIFSNNGGETAVSADNWKRLYKVLPKHRGTDPWEPRDFRRTQASYMAQYLKLDDETIQRCLCHQIGNRVGRAYNRFDYWEPRTNAVFAYSEWFKREISSFTCNLRRFIA